MINILVTGADGQLGRTIREIVKEEENKLEYFFSSKKELDITNKHELDSFFTNKSFDYCINCAAYTNVEQAEKTPEIAYKVNTKGVKNLAEVCKENHTVLIHISTDYVFDGKKKTPYKTTDQTNPINVYGQSKLLGEKHIQDIMEKYFIIRTSWLYSKFKNNFLTSIIYKIKSGSDLNITSSQTGTPTSCIDLACFIYYIIRNKKTSYGIYHYTARGITTWFGFASEIVKQYKFYNSEKLRPIKEFATIAKRPNYSVMDIKKTEFFFKTLNTWQLSVKNTLNSLD